MKLSKKICLTYIVALVFGVFMCIMFFIMFINGTKDGEILRSAEISQGVRYRMQERIEEVREKTMLCRSLIEENNGLINIDIKDQVLGSSDITFYEILNVNNLESCSIFKGDSKNYSEYNDALDVVAKEILATKNQEKYGLINSNNKFYIVSYLRFNEDNKYIVLLRNIDEKLLLDIGKSTGSTVEITNKFYGPIQKQKSNLGNVEYLFQDANEIIYSYSKLPLLNGNDTYLRVGQVKQVEASIKSNFIKLMLIIFIIAILINIILYVFINRRVIKRILSINNAVHKVYKNGYSNEKIEIEDINDEITDLSLGINDMLNRIDSAVNEIKTYSEEMTYLAKYDPLTSIYNRRILLNYIESLEKSNESYNFFYIDLDNFKKLNDTLGHEKGDILLKDVSKELTKFTDNKTKVGRLGGDEFVIITVGSYDEEEILDIGNRVLSSINRTYEFEDFVYDVQGSIGVASYPKDGNNSSTIIKFADIAMYNSKIKGGNAISIFNDEIRETYELENRIKEGIVNDKFIPYFQPIYNVKKDKVDGVEVLIRWMVDDTVVAPERFLNVAKRNGLMADLDKKMFEEACGFCNRWKERFGEFINISVNISNALLIQKEFVKFILETIEENEIPCEYVRLEITEDEIIKDIQYVVSILDYLRDRGLKVALDDFGSGYSSYSYINTLPLDVIKIDRSLVIDIETDAKALSIIRSIIKLSKSLDLKITCEGIESRSQLEILTKLGCDNIQGYLLSKPIPEYEMFNGIYELKL